MSGEQKTTEELEVENERLRQAYKYIHASRNSVDQELNEANKENAALKESLAELIPRAERYCTYLSGVLDYLPDDTEGKHELEESKAAIDRAKKLISENRK